MSDPSFRTIKIRAESYDKVQEILSRVAAKGWTAVGSKRRSAATIADVVDEALLALESKKRRR